MRLFEIILLVSLVVCAVSVGFARDLLTSIVIFMSLQPDHVCYLDSAPVTGPGHYGSCRGGRGHQHPVFHYIEENQGHKQGSR